MSNPSNDDLQNVYLDSAHLCIMNAVLGWELSVWIFVDFTVHADLTMCFKIVHGLVALQSDNFLNIDHDHITRGHSLKLFLPPS